MRTLLNFIALFVFTIFAQAFDHGFGWKADKPGIRATYYHTAPHFKATPLKTSSDLTQLMPPIWDQGQLGACTAFGNMAVFSYAWNLTNGSFYDGSQLGLYYDERSLDGTIKQDAGSQISTGQTVLATIGAGPSKLWPYNIRKFTKKPPVAYYSAAKQALAIQPYKIDSGTSASRHLGIITALSNGYPVVFGAYVYHAIQELTAANPVLPMPAKNEQPIGGHCMVIVGHDDARQLFTVRNSWGADYSYHGELYIPYAYIDSLKISDDFWVVTAVTKKA
jgi:C1A family cysteine protease